MRRTGALASLRSLSQSSTANNEGETILHAPDISNAQANPETPAPPDSTTENANILNSTPLAEA